MSWTDDDPGQGDPGQIALLARDLTDAATSASSAHQQLQGIADSATDAIWQGPAADAFRERVGKLPGHLSSLADSYSAAANGFTAYAGAVSTTKEEASGVHSDMSSAQTDLSQARQQQASYQPPADPASGLPLAGAKNPHDEAVAAANGRIKAAAASLGQLADARRSADTQVISTLKTASNEGMHNKSSWVHAWKKISSALSKITVVITAVVIVAVVVLAVVQPELIPVLLAGGSELLGGLGGASLVSDGVLKASGEDVSWKEIGLDSLAVLPAAGVAGKMYRDSRAADGLFKLSDDAASAGRGGLRDVPRSGDEDLVHYRLTEHAKTALQKYDSGEIRLSARQNFAVKVLGQSENLYKGQRLDTEVKSLVSGDPYLQSRGVTTTPQGVKGPDFQLPNAASHEADWYDLTTDKSWPRHVAKYTGNDLRYPGYRDYGTGRGIIWNMLSPEPVVK